MVVVRWGNPSKLRKEFAMNHKRKPKQLLAVDLRKAMRDAKALPPPSIEVVKEMISLFARRRRLPVNKK